MASKLEEKISKYMNYQPDPQIENYTSQKIKNLHKFLENVELESQHDNQSELSCSQIPSESQETVIMTLRNELQNTKLELSESEKTITLLKELLEKEKNKSRDLESSITEREQKKFVAQKQELEGVIERHLQFIDQLIEDKKQLNA